MHSPTPDFNKSLVPYQLNIRRLAVMAFSGICWFAFYILCGWLFLNFIPGFLEAAGVLLGWSVKREVLVVFSIVAASTAVLKSQMDRIEKNLGKAPKPMLLWFVLGNLLQVLFYVYVVVCIAISVPALLA